MTSSKDGNTRSGEVVHIVDDSPADLAFIKDALERSGYHTVEFTSGADFLRELGRLKEGCVLLDLRLREMSGIAILKEIVARRSDLRVVMISGAGTLPVAVEAMRIGASDFVEKSNLRSELLPAVGRALALSSKTVPAAEARSRSEEIRQHLTPRESEILDLLLKGYRNKQVAHELKVSARTVEAHRANMMRRVGASSFAELIGLVLGNARAQR